MKKKELFILAAFIILKFVLQYVLIDPVYDLHRDEYLHLDQANHLAWGYRSVPPFTSWNSWIIQLLGNGEFWVKFFPALFGAITVGLVWLIVDAFKGNILAKLVAVSGVLFSVLLRLNTLYQPNSFDVLSWTLLFFLLIKYIKTDRAKWLYGASVAFAFGFLNKYNIGFLVAGLLPAILISKHRKVFSRKELYVAIVIALVIITPNLIWQWANHFPVVSHLKELNDTQLVNVRRVDFLRTQFLFYFGSLAVILASLYALLFYKPFKEYRFLLTAFVFILAIFTYLKAKDYYAIGLYPLYIALGAVFLADVLNKLWGKVILLSLIVLPVFSFFYMWGFLFPNKTPEYIVKHPQKYEDMGMLRWEDGKNYDLPQDFADMLGWRELAEITDKAYSAAMQTGETLVLCDNYGQAGAVNFYSQKGIRAVSFNADYIDWFDLDKKYVNLVRVINAFEKESGFRETAPYFQEAYAVDSITNPYARESGTAVYVFKGAREGVDISAIIGQEIKELLKQ